MMKAQISWMQDAMFVGESGSGHAVVMDGPPEAGGRNVGIRPMEMILLGMGACAAFDVVHILKKSRQALQQCTAEVSAQRADQEPKVFTDIHISFTLAGEGLTEQLVERAIKLSTEKYCSASIMLGKTARISHSYKILPTGIPEEGLKVMKTEQ